MSTSNDYSPKKNELEPELHRRRRTAWASFINIKKTTEALTCPQILADVWLFLRKEITISQGKKLKIGKEGKD
uniref:Uncharacterized protein n=1 Tax=Caenorhabditis japonica TaxID=281687 RepID=A0A8R1EBT1_CAEJA